MVPPHFFFTLILFLFISQLLSCVLLSACVLLPCSCAPRVKSRPAEKKESLLKLKLLIEQIHVQIHYSGYFSYI